MSCPRAASPKLPFPIFLPRKLVAVAVRGPVRLVAKSEMGRRTMNDISYYGVNSRGANDT